VAHDWEVDVLASFFNLLYSYRVRWEGENKLWWTLQTKECSMLAAFTVSLHVMMTFLFHGRVFGKPRCIREFFFFAWVAVLGKIISMDNLRNQHVIMVD
jgi:hypothetical protein